MEALDHPLKLISIRPEHDKLLSKHMYLLTEEVNCDEVFIDLLVEKGIIKRHDRQHMNGLTTTSDKNTYILRKLSKGTEYMYQGYVEVLNKTDHFDIAATLLKI